MKTDALDRLVTALDVELNEAPRGKKIAELLSSYAKSQDDWRGFCFFDHERYTRNLVARNQRFELLILGWGPGQESPIHNHEGQDCWMGVLSGDMEEVRYATPEEVRPGPLHPRDKKISRQGEVAFIRDEIALHLVRSAHPGRSAVSLHLYASPYDACNCYCPDTGSITRTKLSYYSIRGRILVPEASP